MGLFNNFPYMDLSNLNLDFILKKLKDLNNYVNSAAQDAETAVNAKDEAVAAKEAAQLSAENAALSEENAGQSAESAQNYAEHIADPVGGLVTGWLDDNITPTTPPLDASLSIQGAAADAKATGDGLNDLRGQINNSVPYEVKQSLDNILQNVAFKNDDGYATDLTVIHNWTIANPLMSISAVFEQGDNAVYTSDSLDYLRQYLTVTARYSDGTTATVTSYSLSGTLTAGTSTITVTLNNKTTTFNVIVTDYFNVWSWDFANDAEHLKMRRVNRAVTSYASGGYNRPAFGTPDSVNRCCFYTTYGREGTEYVYEDGTAIQIDGVNCYPIPIPDGATRVAVNLSPNTQYFGITQYNYNNGNWTMIPGSGWQQGSYTADLVEATNRYLTVNCKPVPSGGSYNTTTYPYPTVTIEFS